MHDRKKEYRMRNSIERKAMENKVDADAKSYQPQWWVRDDASLTPINALSRNVGHRSRLKPRVDTNKVVF